MSPVDADIVRRKLAIIQIAVNALRAAGPVSLAVYRADIWRRKGTERLLQEAIEAAIDASTHIIVRAGRPAPADFYSSFIGLAELSVIDPQLAQDMAPAAGLRNRLVHEYDEVDDERVLRAVDNALGLLPRFVAAIEEHLRRAGGG